MLVRLSLPVFIITLLSSCSDSVTFNQWIKNSIDSDFNKYYHRPFSYSQNQLTSWHNKPWKFKKYKWIETIKQLPNNQKQYQYQNPYSECLVTFIVDSKGVVAGAWTEGIDCGGNH